MQIKEESKVANDHQACSLLQWPMFFFIIGIYFNELRWKIIRANNLLQLIHQVTIDFRFQKSLVSLLYKLDQRSKCWSHTQKWYVTLRHPRMHPHTKFGIPTSRNIGDMHRSEVRPSGMQLKRKKRDGRTVWLLHVYASQRSFEA